MYKNHALTSSLQTLGFHGSYRPEDVTFLLNIDEIDPTPVAEKEYLNQLTKLSYGIAIHIYLDMSFILYYLVYLLFAGV